MAVVYNQPQFGMTPVMGQAGGYNVHPELYARYEREAQAILNKLTFEQQVLPQEAPVLAELINTDGPRIAYTFQTQHINPQTGAFDPNRFVNFVYQEIVALVNRIRASRGVHQIHAPQFGGMQPAQPLLRPTMGLNPIKPVDASTDYYNAGKPVKLAPAPPEQTEYLNQQTAARTGVVVGRQQVASLKINPTVEEKPVTPPIQADDTFENKQGSFDCCMVTIKENEPNDDDKKIMAELSMDGVQQCLDRRQFETSEGQSASLTHIKMLIPYTSCDNCLDDLQSAYPDIINYDRDPSADKFALLVEFPEMILVRTPYAQMVPVMNEIKHILTDDPFKYMQAMSLISNPHLANRINTDIINTYNRMSYCWLSHVSKGNPHTLLVETFNDIVEIAQSNDPVVMNYKNLDRYESRFKSVITSALDTYFHLKDPDRTPYINADIDEIAFISTHESSGIRYKGCVGRNFDAICNMQDDEGMKTISKKAREKTYLLKKRMVLFTNIDLPEAEMVERKDGRLAIENATHLFHHILASIFRRGTFGPLELDMRLTPYGRDDLISGVSLNKYIVISK